MTWENHIPKDLQHLYEIHDYHHGSVILAHEFRTEFSEICESLRQFKMTIANIQKAGGNESEMPKKFRAILAPLGWKEERLKAVFMVNGKTVKEDTHKIDFVKGRVAFDLEWNSKDQTFDRDLFAFSTFFEYDRISVGVLVTRSNDLDPLFNYLGNDIKKKYGASTTHMGKLIPRLEAGRNRGCPILVFGIKRAVVIDAPSPAEGRKEVFQRKKKK